ncbi:hypothetical protein J2795_002919 [Chryseobacterium bernardetii]|jgi:hypothetical protein|uniref:Uncharacterized protein n=2 Tax=Chryseobacterium TaxID=59732 RepID=A0A543EC46_9FLAO|nr:MULTISPECIES: hypothetical protein [Chryseobacterium]MDR6371294.1 hypothetical protein [Chryseobacterium vietnamense]MDR6442201.1 hypothetical protein [Chryseobacterium bernardetii]TQM19079.1 hypothetical protein FB551_3474 [Chryseobacterium aquifrigidense]
MKKINLLILMAIMSIIFSCRTELTNETDTNITQSDFRKTIKLKEALAFKTYITGIKNGPPHTHGKKEDCFSSLPDDATVTVITQHNVTSYSTVIRNLDRSSDVLVYSIDNENKSIGFIAKYKPADLTKNYQIDNFTGTVEYTTLDGRPMGTKELSNGAPLPDKATAAKTFANKIDCSLSIRLIEVECNGEHHTPSEYSQCTASEKPYYVVEITEVCPSGGQPPKGFPNMGMYDGGDSSGNSGTTTNEMSIQDSFNYMLNEAGFSELSAEEYTYIQNNQYIGGQLLSYFYNNLYGNKDKILHGAIQYLIQNINSNETFIIKWKNFEPMLTFADKFLQENSDTLNAEQIFIRQKDLNDAIIQNSNLLLDIPCSELDNWQTVAQHNVPQSVKDKLQNIKNQTSWWSNWQITNLDDGASTKINMDLFPIQINSLPNKPNSTQKYTPEEFFNFFRLNLNLFAEKFTPIVDSYYGINDTTLWNSSNPLGSLIHIEIPINDGTVICSGFGPKAWVFSTIKAPMSIGYDGIHPVSGNRLFGYYVNPNDNSMYIFTRGVDRVSQIATSTPNLANYLIESSAFFGADQLWKGMQDKLSKYINDRNGNANKLPEKTYRPDYTKIKNYLKGKAPLSSLGCH